MTLDFHLSVLRDLRAYGNKDVQAGLAIHHAAQALALLAPDQVDLLDEIVSIVRAYRDTVKRNEKYEARRQAKRAAYAAKKYEAQQIARAMYRAPVGDA